MNCDDIGLSIDSEKLIVIADLFDDPVEMLSRLNAVSEEVDLTINLGKTQYMTNLISAGLQIKITYLQQVNSYKDLGHEMCLERDNQTKDIEGKISLSFSLMAIYLYT